MNYSNHPITKDFRRRLRSEETPNERKLWKYLKSRQLDGYKFRQQHGYGPYVLDFYCPKLRLCIEVDGNVHDTEEVKQKDEERTEFLNQNRITVIRFKNEEIETNITEVIRRIKECFQQIVKSHVQTPIPLT
jgi:very-short-patch-repair endonuclease